MRLGFLIGLVLVLTSGAVYGQTPSNPASANRKNPKACDWCNAEPAYDVMLRDPEWKNANALYQILIVVKSRVTPEQRANIRTILLAMADGPRKPDPQLLNAVTDDFAEGASLRKLTTKQKAGLAINMQSAMHGLNDDYMPSYISTSLAFISNTFNDAGMNTKRARKIVDNFYALVAKARGR